MQWLLGTLVEGEPYYDLSLPFDQFSGINVLLVNTLTVVHPVRTERDAENYVARLGQVAARLAEGLSEADRLASKGSIPPRFILQATIAQMQQFMAPAPVQNPLVSSFVEKMATAAGIPEATRKRLGAESERIVAHQVYPAWKRVIDLLQSLEPRAPGDAGLWRFEQGAEAYTYNLRRYTTTRLTADEIHEIGLREVARLETEMDAILRRLGRTDGSVLERVARLRTDLNYPHTEEGRKRIMADIEQYIRDAERRAASQFDRRPRSPVVAQPYPRFREANAAASYNPPAPDGSRPGTFQMPLRPQRMTRFGLRTLVYHETVPGHHFQIALEMENDALPRFRQLRLFGFISAFGEGWALYAERLAAESGWYDGDLEGLLGQMNDALFRARRLVVDTGLHAKRWTRQQAIDYGIEASEVERYVVIPGQACSYMIGQLKMVELRDKAKRALGDRFAIKEFHNVVLGTGTAPLELLERQVESHIRSASGSRSPSAP
jgi:uncharacterized protein (DUF885 family)